MEPKRTSMTQDILKNIDEVIACDTDLGKDLWQTLLELHHADIAEILENAQDQQLTQLFLKLPHHKQIEVFEELADYDKEKVLAVLDDTQKALILREIPLDEFTDLCEHLSDKDFKKCLEVLHKKDRQKVLSLMKFPADSAGGIMTLEFFTLVENMTVAKAIALLQRVRPNVDLHRQIYVTNLENKLVGYIDLEDLVLKSPTTQLNSILKKVAYVALTQEDQETVAQKMVHYGMMSVPVVNDQMFLIGVIQEDDLIDIIQKEAIEDVQRISAAPNTTSYFEIPFWSHLLQRGTILGALLIFESVTGFILHHYEAILTPFLVMFFTMLVSTGGNTSSQTSAIAIQGMSSGDINESNMFKFIGREFFIGMLLATTLAAVAFLRVYMSHKEFWGSFVVSLALGFIVLLSVLLGASLPVLLRRLGSDPAFSAGPVLATIMDILGLFIYCYVAYLMLGS
ncbi:magnesium transporter [Candidatus Dependentiae bacterium]|nr:magnesium transporter [Candidatus Dependentiae bacterium]